MSLRFLLPLLAIFMATGAHAADKYTFDKSHTSILFFVDHLGFSKKVGEFKKYDGTITFDQKHPEQSTVDVTLYVDGIDTNVEKLNEHLQGKDFFNAEKFPTLHFVSTGVKKTGPNIGRLTGDLTMLGVTKPVTFDVTFNKAGVHPYSKQYVAGFSATGTLKRSDFGMKTMVGNVGDEVNFRFEAELERQPGDTPKDTAKPE